MSSRKDFLKLQNGSDIRGIACEGREGERTNLTGEAVCAIGQAFSLWLMKKHDLKPDRCLIGVGADSRITGPSLKKQLIRGMLAEGVCVADCGMASTPAMFMSIVYPETQYDGAVMITASHLPFNRNGFKFFDKDGGLDRQDITDILELAADLAGEATCEDVNAVRAADPDRVWEFDLIDLYSANLAMKIREGIYGEGKSGDGPDAEIMPEGNPAGDFDAPLKGLKIVVDAGNGAGGFFAERILKELGADITGSAFLNPDGSFPNHAPNPENREAMQAICRATVENHADLGLIFDTDVDRMSAVLSDGTPLNRDAIIAMIAAILAPDYPGATIITDSVTSDRLTEFLEQKLGLKHLPYKRGYKNVINKCRELNQAGELSPLAMETSGHGCLKENYYLDDGAYLAVKLVTALAVLAKQGRKLDELIADFNTEFADREVRYKIEAEDFNAYGQQVLTSFQERAGEKGYRIVPSFEGVRLSFPRGWMILRVSLHDPVLVLNIEGSNGDELKKLMDRASELLTGFL